MSPIWENASFDDTASDMTGGQTKLQRSEFRKTGRLPIIDQGQNLIAGFTDDESAAYRGPLPVVLFGDHTRALKYFDKPFVLGADGVKVLAPKAGFDAKFLYYYWLHTPVANLGYSRHFKLLREISVPRPRRPEQARIVELLDQADALRRQRAEADAKLLRLLPALFSHYFGDPQTNPHGWPTLELGDVFVESAYGLSLSATSEPRGTPFLRMNNIRSDGTLDLDDLKYVELSESELKKSLLREGDLLFNRTNSADLVGKTGLWHAPFLAVAASYLIILRVDRTRVEPAFVWAWMNTPSFKSLLLNRGRRAIGMANINSTELRSFPLFLPPLERQRQFTDSLSQVTKLRTHAAASAVKLETLFQTLLQRAFTGDLTAKWREQQQSFVS